MKATKYTFTITCEVLSKDSIQVLIDNVMNNIESEIECGHLLYNDGDYIDWELNKEEVEF